ncbi:Uncharacterised protein [Bordetella bronchiseptica]|nr:hypothetical protein L525_2831 [Bordetella bronchiseptica MBORD782]VTQ82222.1 Uncharacterised protein [Bordetella bronchiseptica]
MGAARWADAEAAARAVDRVRPLIDAALACRAMGESGFLHVVVMDPLAAGLPFEQAVLYEESFGDTRRWDADYGAYARRKAALSWRPDWTAIRRWRRGRTWSPRTRPYGAAYASRASWWRSAD